MFKVRQAECHDTCLDVEGPDNHVANVNPVSNTNPQEWRVDCDDCLTCVKAGLKTKAEARAAAMEHVRMSVEEYLQKRDAGLIYEVKCNCGSLYEDDKGNTIHYAECDVIQDRLGLL